MQTCHAGLLHAPAGWVMQLLQTKQACLHCWVVLAGLQIGHTAALLAGLVSCKGRLNEMQSWYSPIDQSHAVHDDADMPSLRPPWQCEF